MIGEIFHKYLILFAITSANHSGILVLILNLEGGIDIYEINLIVLESK